ncbi:MULTISPECIES: helix-turn-helix domain-containing protein [Streptomyces]|jgi:transcriptional regulator with XRE-family HTH domain|uniref:Helix-turn-helix transcriptional regulator n=1 Tax=Streptomyces thermoviolaceus subsp. thermoviolaceus TaxID=66860 RepID=A0ABX0YKH0_STRTL|nr:MULTISPECIES: XRE family transcriptional regulator [Streptomyces]MCE7549447.1 XRE family transcriptional regulator [Streptomyces thermodiastaticus]MCM3263999.1 XRE family transcriptional regulator [Streptomyces thermoviolaceus]NJP12894.1 helix-turn-helix transcriptional regulator [Streptomyces thermoviolaceus subsp. thermoviolaceus]RSS00316.1 XRE family transcriptional regulator [Streptomyces sp. WAC00469]WTD49941.1 XRE family transcriptional regulator [Streptomyces thermoviolaceus]
MGDHKEQSLRVGAAVRRRRRALSLTLAVVAERSGLSVPFLSQVENDRARPSQTSLEKIADALRTTAVELLAAADPACSVDVVRAEDTGPAPTPRVRSLVRGHHQLHASEFTGEHEAGREFQHRNDELMYVADGAVEIEAEGRAYRLARGDTMYLTGGVRHRWRATVPETRVVVVAVAEHIEAVRDRRR